MPWSGGERSYLVRYSAGHLVKAALPVGPARIDVESVSHVPGTAGVPAGAFTHAPGNPGAGVVAVILQYER